MGEFVGGTVIFGGDDAEPLLSVTALGSVGIEVNRVNQRLKRRPAVRLEFPKHGPGVLVESSEQRSESGWGAGLVGGDVAWGMGVRRRRGR